MLHEPEKNASGQAVGVWVCNTVESGSVVHINGSISQNFVKQEANRSKLTIIYAWDEGEPSQYQATFIYRINFIFLQQVVPVSHLLRYFNVLILLSQLSSEMLFINMKLLSWTHICDGPSGWIERPNIKGNFFSSFFHSFLLFSWNFTHLKIKKNWIFWS